MLYLLSGESGSGKTIWLAELVAYAQQIGVSIDGLLTPADFQGGVKVGIDCILLPSEEEFPLARLSSEGTMAIAEGGQARRMPWRFDEQAMERANAHLSAINPENPSSTLFIIDELGWLELNEDKGWTEALRILDQGCFEDAIAVVRPALLERALERWGHKTPCILQPGGDVRGFFL